MALAFLLGKRHDTLVRNVTSKDTEVHALRNTFVANDVRMYYHQCMHASRPSLKSKYCDCFTTTFRSAKPSNASQGFRRNTLMDQSYVFDCPPSPIVKNCWRQVVLTFLILLYWLAFGNSHESKITLTSDGADITIKDWSILRKIKNYQRFPGVGQDIALSASPAARFQAK